jgi:rubrerythrin
MTDQRTLVSAFFEDKHMLIAVLNAINNAIKDEEDAIAMYKDMSARLREVGGTISANTLDSIANDETRHKGLLETMKSKIEKMIKEEGDQKDTDAIVIPTNPLQFFGQGPFG